MTATYSICMYVYIVNKNMYTKLITHKTVVIMQWGLNYMNNIHTHVHVVHHIIRRREEEKNYSQ